MRAHDIMTSPVFTVTPATPLVEIVDLMLRKRISAVPVVDSSGSLLGIVSEGDLLRRKELGVAPEQSWWLQALGAKATLVDDFVKTHAVRADEVMTRQVLTIREDTPIQEIASLLERNRIKRAPVLSDGKVVGIVSRANLLQALSLDPAHSTPHPSDADRAIRIQLLSTLARDVRADISHLNFVVRNGNVFVWGKLASASDRDSLKAAVSGVPGVTGVVDNTQISETTC